MLTAFSGWMVFGEKLPGLYVYFLALIQKDHCLDHRTLYDDDFRAERGLADRMTIDGGLGLRDWLRVMWLLGGGMRMTIQ